MSEYGDEDQKQIDRARVRGSVCEYLKHIRLCLVYNLKAVTSSLTRFCEKKTVAKRMMVKNMRSQPDKKKE